MPTDAEIESLAKELEQIGCVIAARLASQPCEEPPIFAIARHVLRREADAELRGLVAACKAVCSSCSSALKNGQPVPNHDEYWTWNPWSIQFKDEMRSHYGQACTQIRGLIAAWHAKWDEPKCEHKADQFNLCFDIPGKGGHFVCRCGAVASAIPGDWQEAGK